MNRALLEHRLLHAWIVLSRKQKNGCHVCIQFDETSSFSSHADPVLRVYSFEMRHRIAQQTSCVTSQPMPPAGLWK